MADNRDIVVIGASAGGVAALKVLAAALPPSLDAAVFCVLHQSPSSPSHLAEILGRASALPVADARDGERIRRGHIYLARPDYHLVLDADTVHLTRGPRENRNRPAVDALFRSAAFAHAGRVIGVVLTGMLDDGTAGLWAIKERGGTAVVQDPADAEFASMPENALKYVNADHVVPLGALAPLLVELTRSRPTEPAAARAKELDVEVRIAREGRALQLGVMELGAKTPYTCPDCHGVLVQLTGGGVPRFRCHTGHAYSVNNLLAAVTEYVEDSLWNAVRAIEESAMLLKQIAQHVREARQDGPSADLFDSKAKDTQTHADRIRQAVLEHQTLSKENLSDVDPNRR